MKPDYLRLSVTSRCNLTCFYCRTPESLAENPASPDLSVSEIAFLAECAAAEGIRKIRLTGGEPLLRADLEHIIRALRATPGIRQTALTTNGIGLAARAAALSQAGLQRINISLDTLRPEKFRLITGQDGLAEVLAGIEAAARLFEQVKINTVVLRGTNDDEIEALVRFAGQLGLYVRFIERYPFCGTTEPPERFLRGAEIERLLETIFGPLEPETPSPDEERLSAPLPVEQTYRLPSAGALPGARVGLISARSHPPCASCGKLRFTAEGHLQNCLFAAPGENIRLLLREKDADGVRRALRASFAAKPRTRSGPNTFAKSPIHTVGG